MYVRQGVMKKGGGLGDIIQILLGLKLTQMDKAVTCFITWERCRVPGFGLALSLLYHHFLCPGCMIKDVEP